MATRNFVPRSGSQGQIGTTTKPWDKVIAITSSFNVHSGSITGHELTLISGSATSTGSFGHLVVGGDIITGDISATASTGSFGHLIVEGNVTASGTIRADAFESVTGGETIDFGDSVNVSGNVTANNLTADSSSFSTRVTNLDAGTAVDSSSFSTRITNLKTDSGSFSTRVTQTELSGSQILSGELVFINITASNNISASGDILADGRIFEKGTSVIDHATAMSIVFGG